ncbi:MAG: hypothetical protein JXA90_09500, partial [Planctomycetes bacterium]|nr:hypothetical protein [Planctomycetota bacterium]
MLERNASRWRGALASFVFVSGRSALAAAVLAAIAVLAALPVLSGAEPRSPPWTRVDEGATGERTGAVLLRVPGSDRLLLVGAAEGAPCVQAFDPESRAWSSVSAAGPAAERFQPYYQAACDPSARTVYCLSGGSVLHAFSLAEGTWSSSPPAAELDGLSWHALACDPRRGKLVAIGADKKAGAIGWTRTVVYDIATGKWSRLEVEQRESDDGGARRPCRELEALGEAAADLAGRIRLAWFRDPEGAGTDEEIRSLAARAESLSRLPPAGGFRAQVESVAELLGKRRLLGALRAARDLSRSIEDAAEAACGVPRSRRNSPLAFDEASGLFVLFGGDH